MTHDGSIDTIPITPSLHTLQEGIETREASGLCFYRSVSYCLDIRLARPQRDQPSSACIGDANSLSVRWVKLGSAGCMNYADGMANIDDQYDQPLGSRGIPCDSQS